VFEPRAIREDRVTPVKTKEVRLLCPHCAASVYATFSYPITTEKRTRAISAAINEHRKLCPKAPPEASRVYRIDYPRGG
jgi:hypothetical protein